MSKKFFIIIIALTMFLARLAASQVVLTYDSGELEGSVRGYLSELTDEMGLIEANLDDRVLLIPPDSATNSAWIERYEEAISSGYDRLILTQWWDQASEERWLLSMNPVIAERVFELAQRLAEMAEAASDSAELFRIYRALAELSPHASPSGVSVGFERAWEEMRGNIANTREVAVSWSGSERCNIRINGISAEISNGDFILLGPSENFAQLICENWVSAVFRLREEDRRILFDPVFNDMLAFEDGITTLHTRGDIRPVELRAVAQALAWASESNEVILMGLREEEDGIPPSLELTSCVGEVEMRCRSLRIPLSSEENSWAARASIYFNEGATLGPAAIWDAGNEEWILIGFGDAFTETNWMNRSSHRTQQLSFGAAGFSLLSGMTAFYFATRESNTAEEIAECDLDCIYSLEIDRLRMIRRREAGATIIMGSTSFIFAIVAATLAIQTQQKIDSQQFTTGFNVIGRREVFMRWNF